MDSSIDPALRAESTAPLNHFAKIEPNPNTSSYPPLSTPARQQPPSPYPPSHQQQETPLPTPYTPQSLAHEAQYNNSHATPDDAHDVGPDGTKRPRACEACRGLKVRCEFDLNNPDGACKRCTKANRNCVITQPSRKRQKKTDSRVAELEKKIDALTATLHATQSKPSPIEPVNQRSAYEVPAPSSYPPLYNGRHDTTPMMSNKWETSPYSKPQEIEPKKASVQPPIAVAGQKRKTLDTRATITVAGANPSVKAANEAGALLSMLSHDGPQKSRVASDDYTDVIDRGLLTAQVAQNIFSRYTEKMAPLMPAVVFPAGTTMAEVRKTKPLILLSILSAASGTDLPELQKSLNKEIMQVYATRIIINGEKALEIIQALLISCIWYWPPEHFEELKFYQLIHMAAVMAIDININRKNKAPRTRKVIAGIWRDHPWRRTPFPDPETVEARRAWLACYFLSCNTAMGLRRQNLIRWSSYLDECIHVLESAPDAAPTDRTLCQWVRSQHIAEEVGNSFSMDDPFAVVTISDAKVQYALKGFERDLEKWSEQVPMHCQSPILKMTEHVLNLYMHEVAMHVDHNVEEFKPPFTEESLRGGQQFGQDSSIPLTAVHINALSTCLTAIDGIFTAFLSIDVDTVRSLPVMHFVRVAYAVVVLIKMYFAAAVEGSELGKVIDKDNMRVEFYLDNLLERFRAAAAEEKSRPSTKFLMVLVMLKTWFHRQRAGKKGSEGATAGAENAVENVAAVQRDYNESNTPLQLLSEVATNGNQARPKSRTQSSQTQSQNQNWQRQQPEQAYMYSSQPMPSGQGYDLNNSTYAANLDPGLSMPSTNYDLSTSNGFEQATGMTLEGFDLNYFPDDALFSAMLDSVGGSDFFPNYGQ